jgi:hypothetical protein
VSTRPFIVPTSTTNARSLHTAGFASVALTVTAIVLWERSLADIDVDAMTDLGLVSVLPATAWFAYAFLVGGFCLALSERPLREWLVACHVVALILMLYALPGAVEDVPRLAAAWRHAGVIEYVTRTGAVDPGIDAYFNWPGFFVLGAFVEEVAGFGSALAFVRWAPVVFPVLFLAPLLVILRAATSDRRLVWLAIWIFFAANWVGQDYFAPQALSFVLYLTVFAALLRWFVSDRRCVGTFGRAEADSSTGELDRWAHGLSPAQLRWFTWFTSDPSRLRAIIEAQADRPTRETGPPARALSPAQRAGVMAVVMVVLAAMVPTHQLTPFATLVGIAALTILGYSRARTLPTLLAVLIGGWVSFMAISYLSGHLGVLAGGVGALGKTLDANVGNRVQGSSEHLVIVYLRLLLTGAVWLLALVGAARSFRKGSLRGPIAVLALAPFLLIAVQPYGGEVLLRVYLFTLPFAAFFVASLFYPRIDEGRGPWTTGAVAILAVLVLSGTLFARYGNERMEHFTQGEVDAVSYLYEVAPPGSVLVSWGRNLPWKFRDYEKFDYRVVTDEEGRAAAERPRRTLTRIDALMRSMRGRRGYFVLTRGQRAENELLGLSRGGSLERVEALVVASSKFDLVYRNADAAIFVLAGEERG